MGQDQPCKAAASKLPSSSVSPKQNNKTKKRSQTAASAAVSLYFFVTLQGCHAHVSSFEFSCSTCHLNMLFLGTFFMTRFFLHLSNTI